ncbi:MULTISPECIES: hypothetical protein [unclassified Mesorhizobium]|uniref:hypothetical protein n=1 Tax=unclassified Mesorhizobium TaxID=325217 RepID=UPI00142ECD15|nr:MULTISPECIES: hypothetical protein [unclassified Mesorhizobium]
MASNIAAMVLTGWRLPQARFCAKACPQLAFMKAAQATAAIAWRKFARIPDLR